MKFDYSSYSAQVSAKRSNNGQADGKKTQFINGLLKENDGTLVVRFPYRSMDDIEFETTHSVKFPGDKWNKRVRCSGNGCPLCAQGVKLETRFFVKAIAYVVDKQTNEVKLVPAIWDRPSAFADIDIKNKMQDYGDLSKCLFKIKKTGEGLDTRYDMNIITNTVIYDPNVYKADFSILDNLDPAKMLTKSIEQYIEAVNGGQTNAQPEEVVEKPVTSARDVVGNYINTEAPAVNNTYTQPEPTNGYYQAPNASYEPVGMNSDMRSRQVQAEPTYANLDPDKRRIRL